MSRRNYTRAEFAGFTKGNFCYTHRRYRRCQRPEPPQDSGAGFLFILRQERRRRGEGKSMAALDWSQCPAVESIPGKRSGAWVFKDTRTPVSVVFDNLEAGATIEDIMEWFHLGREQVLTVLEFAARSLDAPPLQRSA